MYNHLSKFKFAEPAIIISEEAVPIKIKLDLLDIDEKRNNRSSSDEEDDVEDAAMDYLFEPDGLKGRRLSAFWFERSWRLWSKSPKFRLGLDDVII